MTAGRVFIDYFVWHYGAGLFGVFHRWRDVALYIIHLFSIRILLRTLFRPLKRITESYQGHSVEDRAATLVVNLTSRVFGMIVRLALVFVALVLLCVHVVLLPLAYGIWLLAPVFVLYLFVNSLMALL